MAEQNFKIPDPFIETALLGDEGEGILHFGAVRLRIVGTGNLNMAFKGLDDVESSGLLPLALSETPGREPTRLSNFKGQRVYLALGSNKINETFKINRIVIFVKELYSSYPG